MEMSHLTEHGNFIPEFHSERACLKNGYSSAQAKQFDFEPRLYVLRPCVTLLLMYIFFFFFFSFSPAAIQVEITPTQGEISVGDSKFFLCEGKSDLENALRNTT